MERLLEFERVSIVEARWSFESDFRSSPPEPGARTAPQEAGELEHATLDWLAELPDDERPGSLAVQYPRIANEIARRWRRVARCEEYLDELIFDRRGGRAGFPRDVGRDLTRLRDYYASIHPERHSVWEFTA